MTLPGLPGAGDDGPGGRLAFPGQARSRGRMMTFPGKAMEDVPGAGDAVPGEGRSRGRRDGVPGQARTMPGRTMELPGSVMPSPGMSRRRGRRCDRLIFGG